MKSLVSLPDILVPGLLETEKLLSPCQDVTNDVRECYDTAMHPPSEARTTRGQKMNREIVNCVALKLPKRNFREKYVLPPSREA